MFYLNNIIEIYKFDKLLKKIILFFATLFVIDYYNIPTFLFTKYTFIATLMFSLLIIFMIIDIIKNKLYNSYFSDGINDVDKYLLTCLITNILLISNFVFLQSNWKIIVFPILLINALMFVKRMLIIDEKKKYEKAITTYDIKELIEGNINGNKLILINEKEVNYDLFQRQYLIDNLKDLLSECYPEKSFVISLLGSWGSGKSTIIENVKKQFDAKDCLIIDNFKPWQYNDKYTLFKDLFSCISKSLQKDFGFIDYKYMLKKYFKILFNVSQKAFKVSLDIDNYSLIFSDSNIKELKDVINNYLQLNNRKIVVIIDDIDRLNKEQIILIFNTINNIFDFNNFVYLLSYDEERINRIFESELKIDKQYLNKIVNSKLYVSKISKKLFQPIILVCLGNLLIAYKIIIPKDELNDFNKIIDIITDAIPDMREFKRFLNDVSINIRNANKLGLNICDFILLEFIKFNKFDLYNEIFDNPNYYISQDKEYDDKYEHFIDTQKINEDTKKYFDMLFHTYGEYKELLSHLFPSVSKYFANIEAISKNVMISGEMRIEREKSIIRNKIYNARYFRIYFIYNTNVFTQLNSDANKIINIANSTTKYEIAEKDILDILQKYVKEDISVLLERLTLNVNEVKNKYLLMRIFYKNMDKFEDHIRFFGLNTMGRLSIFYSRLFNSCTLLNAKVLINKFVKGCKNLRLIEDILYWSNPREIYYETLDIQIYNYINEKYKEIIFSYVDTNHNIYYDKNIGRGSTWCIYQIIKNEPEKMINYFKKIVNKRTVFKFLYDCVGESVGSKYSYSLKKENIKAIFGDTSYINNIINKIDYDLSPDQKFILDLYNDTIKDDNNSFNTPKEFKDF